MFSQCSINNRFVGVWLGANRQMVVCGDSVGICESRILWHDVRTEMTFNPMFGENGVGVAVDLYKDKLRPYNVMRVCSERFSNQSVQSVITAKTF